ncbi:sugar isomerase (sis) [Lucifera butyrica]|uniref:N-acetylmuramic acid 6-phosphate etherase n=1 Tax=Lucifera butyrica TaxID=1351585 RepID=A0A498RDQ2_9FIRM|nr:N-acetylmuramic acid 6-phosphate etherase [Lucifera butyrica]VBB09105.1 sugar isomerase (sis) [Lucifera butyrica]
MNLENLLTEARNPATMNIDRLSGREIVELINREDHKIAAAVKNILPEIAQAVEWIVASFKTGGRLFYVGAGTSGRLGILDASECPPTYGTDPELVQGLIAGGPAAILRAVEGAEDSPTLAVEDLQAKHLCPADIVVGIAASGRTPYVLGGLQYANSLGCRTIALTCTPASEMSQAAALSLTVLAGPEVVTGSTRMKAGTAQKMVLNMLTTASMIRLGKTYSNLMVDVQATNFKLQERAKRIVSTATGVSREQCETALTVANGSAKLAVTMLLTSLPAVPAARLLEQAGGVVAAALALHSNPQK